MNKATSHHYAWPDRVSAPATQNRFAAAAEEKRANVFIHFFIQNLRNHFRQFLKKKSIVC